jgi:hypothetical protein
VLYGKALLIVESSLSEDGADPFARAAARSNRE